MAFLVMVPVPLGPLRAQAVRRPPRVTFLSTGTSDDFRVQSFRQGLLESGYAEDQNITVDYVFSSPELLQMRVEEILARHPDAIFTTATLPTLAAMRMTSQIPIVAAAVSQPVALGFAESLARPGRNITGSTNMGVDLITKSLEIIREMVAGLTQLAVLTNPHNPGAMAQAREAVVAAKAFGIEVRTYDVQNEGALVPTFERIQGERQQALSVSTDVTLRNMAPQIAALALKHRIPSIFASKEDVAAGGLLGYGPDLREAYRRAVHLLDKVLKGTNPGEIPFEQPSTIQLYVNLKTAKALGLVVPPTLLARADEVME
jgi:putative ABC transport system substrate-binding protein